MESSIKKKGRMRKKKGPKNTWNNKKQPARWFR